MTPVPVEISLLVVESYVVHTVFVVRIVTEHIRATDSLIANSFISFPKLAYVVHGAVCKHSLVETPGDTSRVITDVTIRARRGQNECGVVMAVVVLKLIEVCGPHDFFHLLRILAVTVNPREIVAPTEGFGVSAVWPNLPDIRTLVF